MALATFDTLKFANTLKAAGVPDQQAEAQATVLADALAEVFKDLVTKDDLTRMIGETEQRLNGRNHPGRSDLNDRIGHFETKLLRDFNILHWMMAVLIWLNLAVLILL